MASLDNELMVSYGGAKPSGRSRWAAASVAVGILWWVLMPIMCGLGTKLPYDWVMYFVAHSLFHDPLCDMAVTLALLPVSGLIFAAVALHQRRPGEEYGWERLGLIINIMTLAAFILGALFYYAMLPFRGIGS